MNQTTEVESRKTGLQADATVEDCESFVLFLVHDLEGPLAAMQSLLRLLDRQRFDTDNTLHRQLLQTTHTAIDRARLIVNDLLGVSKLERGGVAAELADIDLGEVIREGVTMVGAAAAENDIQIENTGCDRKVVVNADRRLLARVLDNLLFNAIRHTPESGVVRLAVEDGRESISVSVTNQGEGFGISDPMELFEKFRQVHRRKDSVQRGVGLGLYFCKLAVEVMNGNIRAFQTDQGEACFAFTIPKGGAKP